MNIIVPNGFEANFAVGFVRGLMENDVDVFVASCPATTARLKQLGAPCADFFDPPDRTRSTAGKAVALVRYYARLLALVARHRNSTVHFIGIFRNTRVLVEGFLFCAWFRFFSRRFIYTAHNVLPHGKESSRGFRWLYRQLYRFPDVILVHTQRAREQLIRDHHVPPPKIILTSIGLNEEMPRTGMSRDAARAAIGVPHHSFTLLFFGKVEPYKGVDLLVEAFSRLEVPDKRLLVCGAFTNESYREQIMSLVHASSCREFITVREGHVPNEEAERYFVACDALCLPYRHIYQSGLLFLAPYFGTPLITTDVGAIRSIVEPKLGVVAASNDPAGFSEAMLRFHIARTHFDRDSIRSFASTLSWGSVCRSLVSLYTMGPERSSPQTA